MCELAIPRIATRNGVAHPEPVDGDQRGGESRWEHPPGAEGRSASITETPHVHNLPPRVLFGHHLSLGRDGARCREVGRARPLRDAAAARGQRTDPADGGRLRPRGGHRDARGAGARQDDARNARPLQGRRHVHRLRRSAGPAAARRQVRPRRPGRGRPRSGAGVPAIARVQGGRQPHHRHHRVSATRTSSSGKRSSARSATT